jgi:putative lipase involved disintegration of autophagic bodies
LFSCCCGKVSRGWTAVCGCNDDKKQYQCDNQCLDKSVSEAELYYDYAAVSPLFFSLRMRKANKFIENVYGYK